MSSHSFLVMRLALPARIALSAHFTELPKSVFPTKMNEFKVKKETASYAISLTESKIIYFTFPWLATACIFFAISS